MALLQHTPDKLTLTFRPWYTWIITGICCFVWLPYFFSIFALQIATTTLVCQRPKPNQAICQLFKKNILSFNTQTIPIQELQGAKVEQQDISNSSGQFQKIVLLTKQGEIPLRTVKTFHPHVTLIELNNIRDNINNFVKNSQQASLTVDNGDTIVVKVFIFVIAVNILWLVFCSEVVTCIFDKNHSCLIKKRQWLFITKTVEYPLQDIIDVQVQEKWNRSVKGYRISLLRSSGKDIYLTGYYTNYFKKRKQMDATADAIVSFLNRRKF